MPFRGTCLTLPTVQSGEAALVFDADLRILDWNESAERATGFARADVVGRSCWEVVAGVDASGVPICSPDCQIARACREGNPVQTIGVLARSLRGPRRFNVSTLSVACGGGRVFLHVMCPERVAALGQGAPAPRLTPRQAEVLRLLADGLGTDAIARRLTVSRATARNHVRAVLEKLDAHSRLEAVSRARRLGLL